MAARQLRGLLQKINQPIADNKQHDADHHGKCRYTEALLIALQIPHGKLAFHAK
ncbi:hypothetical protein D3C75_1140240 [compost metagenome]